MIEYVLFFIAFAGYLFLVLVTFKERLDNKARIKELEERIEAKLEETTAEARRFQAALNGLDIDE